MTILILNFIAYAIWLKIAIRKQTLQSVYTMMVALYTLFALCSIICIYDGSYFNEFGYYNLSALNIIPYIYCFITYFFLFLPLYKIKNFSIDEYDLFGNKFFNSGIKIWLLLYVIYIVLKLAEAIISLQTGLAQVYETRHVEGEQLFTYTGILFEINSRLAWFLPITGPIVTCYAMTGMIQQKLSNTYAILLIIISFLPSLLTSISFGSKGALFMDFFCLIFYVQIFWSKITKKIRRYIKLAIGISLSFCIAFSALITLQRAHADKFDVISHISRYFGESFPNLGLDIWENVKIHPMGERMYPEFTGIDNSDLVGVAKFGHWDRTTGVRTWVFKTFFGDLYIEYGTVIALIAPIIISLLFYKGVSRINITTISIIYFYFQICVYAFAGFFYKGEGNIKRLVYTIVIMFILQLILKKNKRGKINHPKTIDCHRDL